MEWPVDPESGSTAKGCSFQPDKEPYGIAQPKGQRHNLALNSRSLPRETPP